MPETFRPAGDMRAAAPGAPGATEHGCPECGGSAAWHRAPACATLRDLEIERFVEQAQQDWIAADW